MPSFLLEVYYMTELNDRFKEAADSIKNFDESWQNQKDIYAQTSEEEFQAALNTDRIVNVAAKEYIDESLLPGGITIPSAKSHTDAYPHVRWTEAIFEKDNARQQAGPELHAHHAERSTELQVS